MRSVQDKTPFETWYGKKPNVNNLCEFGAPIWILHQGQNRGHKIEPKSLQRIFIGFNDRNKTVKYFNPEFQKILTLRCYHFLTLSDQPLPLDNVSKLRSHLMFCTRGSHLVEMCHNQTLLDQTSKNGIARENAMILLNPENYEKSQRLIINGLMIHSQMK